MKPITIEQVIKELRIMFSIDENEFGSTESNGKFFINKQQFERYAVIEMLQNFFTDKYIENGYLTVGNITFVFTTFEVKVRDEKFYEMMGKKHKS